MANVTVKVSVEDAGATPVDGVLVRVFQSDGTTFVTEGSTGNPTPGSGEVSFTLLGDGPGITYVLRLSKSGLYFPAGPTQTVLVTDPPAPDNDFGPYVAEVGPSAQLVKLVVKDGATPLEAVRIRLFDAGDVFLTEALTSASGELELFLTGSASPGTPYIVRLRKDSVSFTDPTQTIAVLDPVVPPDTNVFDFVGTVFVPLASTDPDLCAIYGRMANVSGAPAKKLRLEFKPCPNFPSVGNAEIRESGRFLAPYHSNPTLLIGKILARSVKVDTDATGFFRVELPRGGIFEVHVHGLEDPIEITDRIYVPDAPVAAAADVFYPYVQSVNFLTDPINVLAGESVEVDFTLGMSNMESLEDQARVQALLLFESQDDSIATVALSSATSITVKGIATGGTTVGVTRVAAAVVPSRPTISALVVTPPTVTVA